MESGSPTPQEESTKDVEEVKDEKNVADAKEEKEVKVEKGTKDKKGEEKKDIEDGKDIKEYLPLASAVFLILGALRLIFFYKFFGINIVSFIDLSEILTLSFSFFINCVFIALIFFIIFIPSITDSQIKGIEDRKTGAVALLVIISFFVYFYFSIYDVNKDYIIDFRVSKDTIGAFVVVLLIAIFSSRILPVIKRRISYYFGYNVSANTSASLVSLLGMCILCVLQSRDSARDILLKKRPEHIEIKLDSTLIKTSYSYRFIGKTKSYIFFYNTKTDVSDVYSLDGDKDKKMSFPNELPNLQIGGVKRDSIK